MQLIYIQLFNCSIDPIEPIVDPIIIEEPVVTPPRREAIMLVSRRWKDHPKTGKPIVKGTLDVALGASANESK